MERRPVAEETPTPTEIVSDETKWEVEYDSSLTTTQRLAMSTNVATEVMQDSYSREEKNH